MAYFIAAYITKQRFTVLTKNGGGDHKRRLSRVHYICTMHCVQCTLEKQCTAHHVIISFNNWCLIVITTKPWMIWYFPQIVFLLISIWKILNLCNENTKKKLFTQQCSEAFLKLLAGCVNCIKMFSLTLKYDNDSIKYKVCMEMRNGYHFSNVNRKICYAF